MTSKYKIWDVANQCWFIPTYPGFKKDKNGKQIQTFETKEIFFSQSGEMYMRESLNGTENKFTHLNSVEGAEEFRPYQYTGFKIKDEKIYNFHLVRHVDTGIEGEIIFERGAWYVHFLTGDKMFLSVYFDISKYSSELVIIEHREERLKTQIPEKQKDA